MKPVSRILALAALVLLFAAAASAQSEEEEHATDFDGVLRWPEVPEVPADAPNARLAIYFDLVSRSRTIHAEPNEPFTFYIVARNPHMGVLSWELRLDVPPELHIVGEEIEGLRLGGPGEYMVSTRPEQCQAGDQVVLATLTGLLTEPGLKDLALRLGPVARSSLQDSPSACYVVCQPSKEIRPFDHDELPAIVNPVELSIEEEKRPDFLKPIRRRAG